MKRLYFLSAASAAVLAGCGKHVLPGMTPASAQHPVASSAFKFVPEIPDAIPASVLANPIVGEAHRFVGSLAPANWFFLQGQKLSIADNPQLFSVLGHAPGDKDAKTFTLPNLSNGVIIAAKGTVPSNPRALAQLRRTSYQASLGPGARPASPKPPSAPAPATLEARGLLANSAHVRSASPVDVSASLADAIAGAQSTARDSALQAIGSRSTGVLHSAVAAAVAGRVTVHEAVAEIAQQLSVSEASSVLAINDRLRQSFSNAWVPATHVNAQREAAMFLVTSTITPEQAALIAQREG